MLRVTLVEDIKHGDVLYYKGKKWEVSDVRGACGLYDFMLESGKEVVMLDRVMYNRTSKNFYYRMVSGNKFIGKLEQYNLNVVK